MNSHLHAAVSLGAAIVLAGFCPSLIPTHAQSPSQSSQAISTSEARVFCIHKIQVAAQADGTVDELLVDEGSTVKKGDTLLVIDDRVAAAQLGVAQKEFESAQKQAEQTADVDYAIIAAKVSDAEYDEIYQLYEKTAAAYSEARRKKLEMDRANLQIEVAKVKHQTEILAAEVARERVKAAEVQLGLYKVTAPYDGVIVQRLRDQGEWVKSGEPVLRLVHMNEMKVEAYIPVDNIAVASLQGAPMKVTVRLNPQQVATFTPQVEFVSPEIEGNRVRIATRIPNELIGDSWLLRDGMVANVEITMPRLDANSELSANVQTLQQLGQ